MALILRLEKRKLNRKVKTIFEGAENEDGGIIIPAMVLAEVGYLAERGKIETNLEDVKKYCAKYKSIVIEPITEEVIEKAFEIDFYPVKMVKYLFIRVTEIQNRFHGLDTSQRP